MNLRLFLEEKANKYGDKTAIVCGNQRLSYREMDEVSNRVASELLKIINKGERVAILLPNSIEFVAVYLGTAKIGGIAVPLDPRYKVAELTSIFKSCQPAVLVADSNCLAQLITDLAGFKSVRHVIEVGSRFAGRFLSYDDMIAKGPAKKIEVAVGDNETVHLGYTSGPTSHPTGVMLSHHHLIAEAEITVTAYNQTEKDVMMLFALPMNHVFGLVDGLLATLCSGGKVVILPGLSLSSLMELIEREKGTIFMGVPYIFVLLVHMAEEEGIKYNLSSLRLCISGGDCVPDNIALKFKNLYGLDIDQVWGLTEATAICTCTHISKTWKLGSAGSPIPGWEVRVVDNSGRELPKGQAGELMVRGLVMQGYYNNPEATARAIENGWLYTGDIGKIDKDGDVYIVGRKKKMAIVKGQNIYPVDIEEVLKIHPMIAEAVVIGIPNELRGEIIGAAIVLKEGRTASEDDIKKFGRQYLINYKVPKRVIFLSSLPGTADDKIKIDYLRKLFADTLAATGGPEKDWVR